MTEDDEIAEALTAAGDKVHERLWRLPLNDEMRKMMEGKDADFVISALRMLVLLQQAHSYQTLLVTLSGLTLI